jgi:hypothetical protein
VLHLLSGLGFRVNIRVLRDFKLHVPLKKLVPVQVQVQGFFDSAWKGSKKMKLFI